MVHIKTVLGMDASMSVLTCNDTWERSEMKDERTLAFCLSKKMSIAEVENVSGAMMTSTVTLMGTSMPRSDVEYDIAYDM